MKKKKISEAVMHTRPGNSVRGISRSLRLYRGLQLGTKDLVPKLASDAKAQFVVEEMMSEMVLLQLLVPQGQVFVMQEVVCQVVADVAKYAPAVNSSSCVPAVPEESLCQLPEGSCENYKQCRGHDESVLVHGQIVMDAMQQEVQCNEDSVVREVAAITCE